MSTNDRGNEGCYTRALEHMTEVLLTETNTTRVLEGLTRITCETLGADRSLIYEISFKEQLAIGHTEWLNPSANAAPTKATYPLAAFVGGDTELRRSERWLESHTDDVHSAFVSDGSAPLLHGDMSIQSLLWFPFDFHNNGYYLLAFNQVTHRRAWTAEEIEFLRIATRHATLALMQMSLQAERAESQRALLEAQKAESIALLAGGVAHDFNGLLGIVLGLVGRTRAALGEEHELAKGLRDAERAAMEAVSLAKHLLAYAGGGQFVVDTIDLAALAHEMQELLGAAVGDVKLSVVSAGPCLVNGDAGQLRQVLMNLVVNAAEAMDDPQSGKIWMSVSIDNAKGTERSDGSVKLEVRDSGRGMSSEVQRRIFEPFFTTKTFGRGLGLAAVSGIVRTHGGELSVESAEGKGTTVSAYFPIVATKPVLAPTADPLHKTARSGGSTVLLVDDNENFRRMCVCLLADLGYSAHGAATGEEALALLCAGPDEFDAVVLDWTMPDPGGAETFRRLRKVRADLPIVVMSGYAGGGAGEIVCEGAAGFIEKPFTPEALDEMIRVLLAA